MSPSMASVAGGPPWHQLPALGPLDWLGEHADPCMVLGSRQASCEADTFCTA